MTIHPWIEGYIITALSINRLFTEADPPQMPFVDYYYGPPHLKDSANTEAVQHPDTLRGAVDDLRDTLPMQDFAAQRSVFLHKHLCAMESVCRMMSGQRWVLMDEIETCLDIQPVFIPDSEFEQHLRLLDNALPGSGDLRSRYQQVHELAILSADQVEAVVRRILNEVRFRTSQHWTLPDSETLDLHLLHEMQSGAANWYLGNFRSRLELNVHGPVNLFNLIYQMCHEAYPGHHTEFVMKEQHLYYGQGCAEQSIFILGPQLVIAEGIASEAVQMIFTPEALAAWIQADILPDHLPALNATLTDMDLTAFVQFSMTGLLDDIGGNLLLMSEAGESEARLIEYAMAYTPFSVQRIRNFMGSIASPLQRIYAFSYPSGKRLVKAAVQRAETPISGFQRLLTEQIYPSALAAGE